MRVVILHSDVRSCASADERDVLTQVEAVSARPEGARPRSAAHAVLPRSGGSGTAASGSGLRSGVQPCRDRGRAGTAHSPGAGAPRFHEDPLHGGADGGDLPELEQARRKETPSRPSSPHASVVHPPGFLCDGSLSGGVALHRQIGVGACLGRARRRFRGVPAGCR